MATEPPKSPIELHTSLGKALAFRSMAGDEEISRLFEYTVIAVSENHTLAAKDLLGTSASVSLQVGASAKRWFHGKITGFGIEKPVGRQSSYRLTLRPWLWLATRSANLRIFQQKTVLDIVKAVLAGYGGALKSELQGSYTPREYCVQYRESDFDFVSRLLEEEGIYYFFRHTQSQLEMVLGDRPGSHADQPGFATIPFSDDPRHASGEPAITEWHMQHEIQTRKFVLNDYNFTTPSTSLMSSPATSSHPTAGSEGEWYDYPGRYEAKSAGNARSVVRLAEADSRYARYSGAGNSPGLAAGSKFKLKGHWRSDQDAEYLVLATRVEMELAGYESGDTANTRFRCSFRVQPYAEAFRPERITPKPEVGGPQTAVVVGQGSAGDIFADKYARVKVQFHWDRQGQKNAESSCWVRVASGMAGNGWGMLSIPRIGQEVVVDFLEGDPDRPIITGRVHNAEQMPPYALPDHATVSTIKSRSKGGGADKFNELRMEDQAGSEYLLLHAQKDRLEFVEETLKSAIGKEEHRTTKKQRREKIEDQWHLHVAKDVLQKFDEKLHLGVGKDILVKSGGKLSLKTAQDIVLQSGAAAGLKTTGDLHLKIGANIGAEGAQNVHIKGGMNVVIEGGMQVSIKAGGSSVVLGPDGVSITGTMVKVNSGGSPGSGSGANPPAPTDPDEPQDPQLPEDPLSHR